MGDPDQFHQSDDEDGGAHSDVDAMAVLDTALQRLSARQVQWRFRAVKHADYRWKRFCKKSFPQKSERILKEYLSHLLRIFYIYLKFKLALMVLTS